MIQGNACRNAFVAHIIAIFALCLVEFLLPVRGGGHCFLSRCFHQSRRGQHATQTSRDQCAATGQILAQVHTCQGRPAILDWSRMDATSPYCIALRALGSCPNRSPQVDRPTTATAQMTVMGLSCHKKNKSGSEFSSHGAWYYHPGLCHNRTLITLSTR